MQLYTVIIQQQSIVSSFDSKGNKTSEESKMIEVTIRDMPDATARMYKSTDPHGTCQIIAQSASIPSARNDRSEYKRSDRNYAPARSHAPANTSKPSRQSAINQAAVTGDLSAAINN